MTRATQRDRLLRALAGGHWRSLAYLVFGLRITRVSARIFELRKAGHQIVSREKRRGVERLVEYRMERRGEV